MSFCRTCQHAAPTTTPLAPAAQSFVRRAIEGPGESMPQTMRRLEPSFGRRFDQIRIHSGPAAALTARALGTRAFTVGRDIVVDAARVNPGATEGQRLLAHEAAHTIQQGGGQAVPHSLAAVSSPHEAEADRAATAAVSGGAATIDTAVPPGTIQRDPPRRRQGHQANRTVAPPPPVNVPVNSTAPAPPANNPPSTTPAPPPPAPQHSGGSGTTPPTPAPPTPAAPTGLPDMSITATGPSPQSADDAPHAAIDQSLVRTTDFHARPPYPQTSDFQVALTYRNWHVRSPLLFGRHLDVLHEPNVFSQFSFDPPAGINPAAAGPLRNTLIGASASILNYHLFSLHGQDLLEVSLDAAGGYQTGDQGNAVQGQLGGTGQLHLNTLLPELFGPGAETLLYVNVSGIANLPVGATPPGVPPQSASLQFGQVSFGVKVQY